MERDFYTDEFEDLVKLKADQYRMYPSDRVWKGVVSVEFFSTPMVGMRLWVAQFFYNIGTVET